MPNLNALGVHSKNPHKIQPIIMMKNTLILLALTPLLVHAETKDNEHWKAVYFKKSPEADIDKDGKLSWYELAEHKKLVMFGSKGKNIPKPNEKWVAKYLEKYPASDLNKDGTLRWSEIKDFQKTKPAAKLETPAN